MKDRILTFIIFFILSIQAEAATFTVGPSDCSAGAVNGAIASATDGDTVELTCTGTANWSTTVTIPNTKGITLAASGGSNTPKASATFPLTISSTGNPIIEINCENNRALNRVTGFKLQNTFASTKGGVFVQGRGTGRTGIGCFRIDNNYFDHIQLPYSNLEGTITVWSTTGVLTGVIDNNTLHDSSYTDGYVISIEERWQYGGSGWPYAGQNAWTRPLGWGTSDFIFIENNLIEQQTRYSRHLIEAIQGGKYVARYNTFIVNQDNLGTQSESVEAHGFCFCQSIGHGSRGGELYRNTYSGTKVYNHILLRGGTWVVHDETFNSTPSGNYIFLREYRAGNSAMYGQCDASCPSDPTWFNGATDASHYPMHEQIGFNLAGTSEPSYFWNNLRSGMNQAPVVDSAGVQRQYIQLNRDYFVQNTPPGYVPYTYPHPLTSTGNTNELTPPPAPANLRVM